MKWGILATGTIAKSLRLQSGLSAHPYRTGPGEGGNQRGAHQRVRHRRLQPPCPDPLDVRHPHELGHEVCG